MKTFLCLTRTTCFIHIKIKAFKISIVKNEYLSSNISQLYTLHFHLVYESTITNIMAHLDFFFSPTPIQSVTFGCILCMELNTAIGKYSRTQWCDAALYEAPFFYLTTRLHYDTVFTIHQNQQ